MPRHASPGRMSHSQEEAVFVSEQSPAKKVIWIGGTKPVNPPATLTYAEPCVYDPQNLDMLDAADTRKRTPDQRTGTWGDRVMPGDTHTSDPKAPKVL